MAWRVAFTLVIAGWSLLLLAWLILQWGIVPRVEQWKPQIEQRASVALGVPVSIGAIRVRSSGWIPLIELDDVLLAPRRRDDGGNAEALRLPRVHAALSARSLLGLELRFEQLHVEGAVLEVRRHADGRIFVGGIEWRSGGQTEGADHGGTEWLLAQHEVVVRQGQVLWIDELRGAPPLALSALDLVLRNGLRRHDIRIDATPPAGVGERFTLMGRFTQPLLAQRADWRRWSGSAYANLPRADAAALRPLLPALPFQVDGGHGALRAWVELHDGQPQAAQIDLALQDLALRFAGRDAALQIQQLQGRVSAERDGRLLRLAAAPLAFHSGGIDWPATRLTVALRERDTVAAPAAGASAPASPFDGGEFSADRIDLASLARLAGQLPLGTAVENLLAELAPSGQLKDLSARWEGPLDAPQRYQLKGQAVALSIAAAPSA